MHGRHGGGGHGRGPGPGRHRHRGRAAQMLEPAVMVCLESGPAHGYALAEQLEAYGLGQVALRRIYRLLRGLEEQGWVASTWETEQTQGPPRRIYELTDEGERALTGWMQHLKESRAALDRLIRAYEEAQHTRPQ